MGYPKYLLKAVQGSGRRHTSDAGPIHRAQLDLRDVERHRGGLQPRLHDLQRTRQDGANCATAAEQQKGNRVEGQGLIRKKKA